MFENIKDYIVKKLGRGHFGTAYLLKNGTVLKITRDKSEALFFNSIKNKRLANICKIYGVYKVGNRYYIFKEYLTPISNEFIKRVINIIRNDVKNKYNMFTNYTTDELDKNDSYLVDYILDELSFPNKQIGSQKEIKKNIPAIRKFVKDIIGMYSDSHKIIGGVQYGLDLHQDNIGYNAKGTLKLFDINIKKTRDLGLDKEFIDGDESNMPLSESENDESDSSDKSIDDIIKSVKPELTYELYMGLYKKCIDSPSLISEIPKEYNIYKNHNYFYLCNNIVRANGLYLQYIPISVSVDESDYIHICIEAINQNIDAVKYIKVRGDKLFMILKNCLVWDIHNIKNLDIIKTIDFKTYFNLCKYAVSDNVNVIKYINLNKVYMDILNKIINGSINNKDKYNAHFNNDNKIFSKYIDEELGSGSYGTAYLLKNGKVLKITRDLSEVKFFNIARKRNFPHIAHVYGIYKSKISNGVYYIFKEKLNTLGYIENYDDYKHIINEMRTYVLINNRDLNTILAKNNKSFYNYIIKVSTDSFEKNMMHNLFNFDNGGKNIKKNYFNKNLFDFIEELKKVYIDCIKALGLEKYNDLDINSGNIGYNNKGILKVFDISTSRWENVENKNLKGIEQPSEKLMPISEDL